jgi:hypothetical protein
MDLTLLSLDEPTETRTFDHGRFELYSVGPMTIGRATYEPGWRWSEHVGCRGRCGFVHGRARWARHQRARGREDGQRRGADHGAGRPLLRAAGHDSWVVGNEPYISLHVMGSENYAT